MKKAISLLLSAIIVTTEITGCSQKNQQPEYKSESFTDYQSNYYSFSLNDDLTPVNYELDDELSFEGGIFSSITVTDSISHCTAKCTAEMRKDSYEIMPDLFQNIETEDISGFPYDVSAVHYDYDKNGSGCSEYFINAEDRILKVTGRYNKRKRSQAKAILEEIISTVTYTSDYKLPDTPQTIESDYFTVDYSPVWAGEYNADADDNTAQSAEFHIAASDNKYKAAASVEIKAASDGDHSTAAEYADSEYDEYSSLDKYTNVSRDKVQFNGCDAEMVSAEFDGGQFDWWGIPRLMTNYYIDKNNVVYCIEVSQPAEKQEDVSQSISELLESISIRELSGETLERLTEANNTAKIRHCSFQNIEFDLSRKFKDKTNDDSDDGLIYSMSKPKIELTLSIDPAYYYGQYKSLDDYLEVYSFGQYETERTKTTVNGREAAFIRSVTSTNGSILWDHYIFAIDDEYKKFMLIAFEYNEKESEDVQKYIDQMISSIRFTD